MKTVLVGLAAVVAILVAPLGITLVKNLDFAPTSSEVIDLTTNNVVVPQADDLMSTPEIKKLAKVKKTLVLEAKNTVVFRGPVTKASVGDLMAKMQKVSYSLSVNTPIYLILDTPGGSVFDGIDFIDFANALPQKIHTVTLFAASMGFQIAQNLDKRYIIRGGTLMSHRAQVGGMGGQLKGEFESRYKMIKRAVDFLDYQAATRMGMSVKAYEDLIFNEYWIHGFDAIADKAADEQVLVKCGRSLEGSEKVDFSTFFGTVTVEFSKCPLIKSPISINASKIAADEQAQVKEIILLALRNKPEFVKKYITTDRFYEFFQ